jgi:hypothetical protein
MDTFQERFSLECVKYDLQLAICARIEAEERRDESLARNKILEEQLNDAQELCMLLESIRDLVCTDPKPQRRTSTRSVRRVNYKE